MLYREVAGGALAISQPAHAWVCGQLARAWGNERVGAFAPWEEVCLAAEQHDVGMATWEIAPTFDPATGRAHTFMAVPEPQHTWMFADAARLLLSQSRYAALLASLHFTGLAARHDFSRDTPEGAAAVRDYQASEPAWQEALLTGLRADLVYAPHVAPEALARNRRLVAAWDWLSLLLLMGLRGPTEVAVPGPPGAPEIALTMTPAPGDATHITLSPWPFARDAVSLRCEGRLLTATHTDESALRAALDAAPWVTMELRVASSQ